MLNGTWSPKIWLCGPSSLCSGSLKVLEPLSLSYLTCTLQKHLPHRVVVRIQQDNVCGKHFVDCKVLHKCESLLLLYLTCRKGLFPFRNSLINLQGFSV